MKCKCKDQRFFLFLPWLPKLGDVLTHIWRFSARQIWISWWQKLRSVSISGVNMANDTVCDDPNSNSMSTPMMYVPFIVLPFHISNIVTILFNHKFHQNVYFLLLNLCVSLLYKIPFLDKRISVHLLTSIDVILHHVFEIVALILLIAASLYVLCVRKRHMEEIRKRRRYFGLHEEEFNMLKSMAFLN